MIRPSPTTVLLLILLLTADAAHASPDSRKRVEEGAEALAARRHEEALARFEAAVQADPGDPEARFFKGVALNRMGRHGEALETLEKAASLGCAHPDLAFESGWSLMGLGRWAECIPRLEAYDRDHPGLGQTREFLGRAHLGLREYDQAEACFREAVRRDPRLVSTVRVYQAMVAQGRDDQPQALEHLSALMQEAPDSPTGRVLRDQLSRLETAGTAKPWLLHLSLGAGHNSNVIALGDGFALPSDISRDGADFLRATLDARRAWKLDGDGTFTAGYSFLEQVHDGLHDFDLQDHLGTLDVRRPLSQRVSASLRLSDEFTRLGNDDFRNQAALRPALAFRHAAWGTSEVAYTFAVSDYFFPSAPVLSRDGETHAVNLTEFLTGRGGRLKARLGYLHQERHTEGRDFDSRSDGYLAGLDHPLVWKIELDALYTRTFEDYTHPNSQSTGRTLKRQDTVETFSAQALRPFSDRLDAYLQYAFVDNASNIPFYDYHQVVWSAGVILKF